MGIQLRKTIPSAAEGAFTAALRDFKRVSCDENALISAALAGPLHRHLIPTVLDVGAGLGDIADKAFPDLEAVLLDVFEVPAPRNPRHKRIVGNFLDFVPQASTKPQTLLVSHVLQYLDDDVEALQAKVAELSPKSVIVVLNDNTGLFGDLIRWGQEHASGANPELPVPLFPSGAFAEVERYPFRATFRSPDFRTMAEAFVTMLLDAPRSEGVIKAAENKLSASLADPTLFIDQTIFCYEAR